MLFINRINRQRHGIKMKKYEMKFTGLLFMTAFALFLSGCTSIKLNLFTGKTEPLREYILSGSANQKVLIIPVEGIVSNHADFSLVAEHPGMLENITSQLQCAEQDDNIKAVLLKVDSPGGLVTASDILYNEIAKFKKKTGKTIVVSMMDFATSGAYMISLPADMITAHPTTVTGSIGVVFMRPQISGLMDKIGVSVDVSKSGSNKDMGSPFRKPTPDEENLFQHVIDSFNAKFVNLIKKHRKINPESLAKISTARIFISEDALNLGLIDKICYLEEALDEAKSIAKLPQDARVVIYRRKYYPNDNIYNTSLSQTQGTGMSLIDLGVLQNLGNIKTGFYYIWPGAWAEGK